MSTGTRLPRKTRFIPEIPGKSSVGVTIVRRWFRGRQRGRHFQFISSCIIFVRSTTTSHHGDSETNSNAGPGSYMPVGIFPIRGLWTCEACTVIQNNGSGASS
jgi:hypothetical protein